MVKETWTLEVKYQDRNAQVKTWKMQGNFTGDNVEQIRGGLSRQMLAIANQGLVMEDGPAAIVVIPAVDVLEVRAVKSLIVQAGVN